MVSLTSPFRLNLMQQSYNKSFTCKIWSAISQCLHEGMLRQYSRPASLRCVLVVLITSRLTAFRKTSALPRRHWWMILSRPPPPHCPETSPRFSSFHYQSCRLATRSSKNGRMRVAAELRNRRCVGPISRHDWPHAMTPPLFRSRQSSIVRFPQNGPTVRSMGWPTGLL